MKPKKPGELAEIVYSEEVFGPECAFCDDEQSVSEALERFGIPDVGRWEGAIIAPLQFTNAEQLWVRAPWWEPGCYKRIAFYEFGDSQTGEYREVKVDIERPSSEYREVKVDIERPSSEYGEVKVDIERDQ